jgi:hypothetical protein
VRVRRRSRAVWTREKRADIGTQDNGFLTQLVPGIPFETLRLDWADLRRAGLVENEPVMGSELPGFSKFVTQYGLEFDLFTRLPYDDVHPPGEAAPARFLRSPVT